MTRQILPYNLPHHTHAILRGGSSQDIIESFQQELIQMRKELEKEAEEDLHQMRLLLRNKRGVLNLDLNTVAESVESEEEDGESTLATDGYEYIEETDSCDDLQEMEGYDLLQEKGGIVSEDEVGEEDEDEEDEDLNQNENEIQQDGNEYDEQTLEEIEDGEEEEAEELQDDDDEEEYDLQDEEDDNDVRDVEEADEAEFESEYYEADETEEEEERKQEINETADDADIDNNDQENTIEEEYDLDQDTDDVHDDQQELQAEEYDFESEPEKEFSIKESDHEESIEIGDSEEIDGNEAMSEQVQESSDIEETLEEEIIAPKKKRTKSKSKKHKRKKQKDVKEVDSLSTSLAMKTKQESKLGLVVRMLIPTILTLAFLAIANYFVQGIIQKMMLAETSST